MAELETTHVFNGAIEHVFRTIGKFELYPKYIPGVTAAQIEPAPKGSSARCRVRFEVTLVKTVFYTLEMQEEAPKRIWWSMVESNLMKVSNGSWDFEAAGPDKTKATYKLDIKFKGLVPSMITDQLAKANLPMTFAGFQKMIDES